MRVTRMQLECESIRAQVACKPHTTKHFMHSSHTLPAYKQDCLQVIRPFRSHAEACDLIRPFRSHAEACDLDLKYFARMRKRAIWTLIILLACRSVRFRLRLFHLRAEACNQDLDYFACMRKHAIWTCCCCFLKGDFGRENDTYIYISKPLTHTCMVVACKIC